MEEFRQREWLIAQRCAELRSLARTFGEMARDVARLHILDEKDENIIDEVAGNASWKALRCRRKAAKLEKESELLRHLIKEDTRYKVQDANWEEYFLRKK